MSPLLTNKAALALCLAGALLVHTASAARTVPVSNGGLRRLRGLAVTSAAARLSTAEAAGSTSSAVDARTLSSATSTNAAGVTASASNNWDFDKSDDDDTDADGSAAGAAASAGAGGAARPQRRLGAPSLTDATGGVADFPDSDYPQQQQPAAVGSGGRKLLMTGRPAHCN